MIEYINSLKWPAGEFSHTDLAKLNGKTNQQVWTRYEQARKDNYIISAGEKKLAGKGKPTKMWKLNPNFVAPVVSATPATPVTAPVTSPAVTPTAPVIEAAGDSVVLPSEAEMEAAADATAQSNVPAVTAPAVAPAAPAPAIPSVATVIETAVETAQANGTLPVVLVPHQLPLEVQNQSVLPAGTIQLADKCPVCGEPLFAVPDATGVMVWCAQPPEKCKSAENPFGHGKDAKEGVKVLMEKWTRAMANAPVAA